MSHPGDIFSKRQLPITRGDVDAYAKRHRELEVAAGAWPVMRKKEFDVQSTVDPNR